MAARMLRLARGRAAGISTSLMLTAGLNPPLSRGPITLGLTAFNLAAPPGAATCGSRIRTLRASAAARTGVSGARRRGRAEGATAAGEDEPPTGHNQAGSRSTPARGLAASP